MFEKFLQYFPVFENFGKQLASCLVLAASSVVFKSNLLTDTAELFLSVQPLNALTYTVPLVLDAQPFNMIFFFLFGIFRNLLDNFDFPGLKN